MTQICTVTHDYICHMENSSLKYKDLQLTAFLKSMLFILVFIGFLMICGKIRYMIQLQPMYSALVYGILGCMAGIIVVWGFLKVEKRSISSIGLIWEKKTFVRFVLGVAIGILLFATILLGLLYFSALTIRFNSEPFSLAFFLVYLPILPLALMEEIGFRSYPQIRLNKAYGIWTSQIVIAIVFGAYHILNGWRVYTSFTGPFVWAFVFGLAALWSRGIAVPTGIHFSLNVLQNIAGMKGSMGAIWVMEYPVGTTKLSIEKTETIGLLLHIAVLIGALLATAIFHKKMK